MSAPADDDAALDPSAVAAEDPGTPTSGGADADHDAAPALTSRLSDAEFARLRAKVDGGQRLDDAEEAALRAEMQRATDATKPAAAVLGRAADEEARRVGYDLDYFSLEELWEADPALRAVKRIYERERARWRRAHGIVDEHLLLVDGEAIELDRRAPYRFDAQRERDRPRRRRFSLRRG